jgi:hypothetical protein
MKIDRIPFGKISGLKSTACGLAAALTASLSSNVDAVDIVWGPNANGGNGLTWDTTNQNWTTVLATPWAGYGNFAVLGAADVTISTPVRVDGFSGSGSIGGGDLRLGGSGVTSTFSGTLGSSTRLIWDNSSFVDFSGANNSTNQWVMRRGGTLRLSGANAFKATSAAKIECGLGEGFTMELAAGDLSLNLGACRTYVCVLKSTLQNARYRVFIQI